MLPTDPNASGIKYTLDWDIIICWRNFSIYVYVLLVYILRDQTELKQLKHCWDPSGSFVMIFLHHTRAPATHSFPLSRAQDPAVEQTSLHTCNNDTGRCRLHPDLLTVHEHTGNTF